MSVGPIYFDFGKYWKSNLITLNLLFDFFLIIRFLVEELIAWEGHDFESFGMVVRVELSELFVIKGSETSLSSYIDDEKCLGSSRILLEVNDLAVNVLDFKLEEV